MPIARCRWQRDSGRSRPLRDAIVVANCEPPLRKAKCRRLPFPFRVIGRRNGPAGRCPFSLCERTNSGRAATSAAPFSTCPNSTRRHCSYCGRWRQLSPRRPSSGIPRVGDCNSMRCAMRRQPSGYIPKSSRFPLPRNSNKPSGPPYRPDAPACGCCRLPFLESATAHRRGAAARYGGGARRRASPSGRVPDEAGRTRRVVQRLASQRESGSRRIPEEGMDFQAVSAPARSRCSGIEGLRRYGSISSRNVTEREADRAATWFSLLARPVAFGVPEWSKERIGTSPSRGPSSSAQPDNALWTSKRPAQLSRPMACATAR
jgi:hypothetical protein